VRPLGRYDTEYRFDGPVKRSRADLAGSYEGTVHVEKHEPA
jgi:hypothetical protein